MKKFSDLGLQFFLERLSDFFVERLHDFFWRGGAIFFDKRLHDFFC